MLLTGFDSKYLNTMYIDKNLKHHGLIQAFSRTNRVLNATKPYGNILDFRSQQNAVNQAIALFSGEESEKAREVWLVEPAPAIIEKYKKAVEKLGNFMAEQGLSPEPQEVYNLKGDAARAAFIKNFKEVQRLKTQLDQYTDINEEQLEKINTTLPEKEFLAFRSSYLETSKQLQDVQRKIGEEAPDYLQELDFEFVLFASAIIDYDYIMGLIADSTQKKPSKQKMTKAQIISLLKSTSNLMDEEEELTEYINGLDWEVGQNIEGLHSGFEQFKEEKYNKEISAIASAHGLETEQLKNFINAIMERMIFDGEKLTDLLAPLELGWKDRKARELSLMDQLIPQLRKLAQGREISGLAAYEKR